jgi:hypothetical protein
MGRELCPVEGPSRCRDGGASLRISRAATVLYFYPKADTRLHSEAIAFSRLALGRQVGTAPRLLLTRCLRRTN